MFAHSLPIFLVTFTAISIAANSVTLGADENKAPNYNEHIKTIIRQYCLKCHGDEEQEGDINLQQFAGVLRGGSGGKVVVAGRSSQSLLFKAITSEDADARMPPNSPPLPKEKIEIIRRWIDSGLRETSASKSMVKSRDLVFVPSPDATAKPVGPPAMPRDLPPVDVPRVKRPLAVLALDASPWAPLVAVAGLDHVKLFNSDTQQEIGQLAFPEGEPFAIRFSRNGQVLMVAGGQPVQSGKVVLFDVQTGKRLAEVGDEIDAVLSADISPDQRLVALGGSGRVVKVYSTTDGTLQYKLTKHTDWITAVAFSPDGTKLVTGDRAGGVHLWDARNGGIQLNLAEHKAAVRALDWRRDSKLIASASEDGKIIWWDVTDGFPAISKPNAHPPRRPPGTFGSIPNGVLAARFDRNGNLVTSGRDRVVRVWDGSGNPVATFNIESGFPISNAVSHNGKKVICGDTSGTVSFFVK